MFSFGKKEEKFGLGHFNFRTIWIFLSKVKSMTDVLIKKNFLDSLTEFEISFKILARFSFL